MDKGRLLLVRHGQSTWNAESRWQGQADPPLSDLGERQARSAAPAVAALAITALVTSDLVRARRTAELVAPSGVEVVVDGALRERDAGEWTGLTRDEIEDRYPGYLQDDGTRGFAPRSPPGFEQDEPLLARVLPALTGVIAGGGVALVVSHGGVIRTVERILGAPSVAVPNLGGRWVHADGEGGLALGDRELLIDPDEVELTIPRQL